MKKFGIITLMLSIMLVIAACGTDKGDDTKTSSGSDSGDSGKVYKVGIDTTYPPFEFEVDGKYTGIDIDIITAIAKNQGFEIEFDAMDFGGIIPAMQADQLDIAIAGMSITDDRKKVVDFSDPYFDAGLTLVVATKTTDIKGLEDLKGKTVAVKNGTTGAQFALEHESEYGFELVQFDDSPAMFQEVSNGNADALIEDYPVIAYAISQNKLDLQLVGERLNGDQYGIAVLKGKQADVLKQINDGLQDLRDSGEYDKILDKYLAE
ncbi:transporter substrate-binding domain-containing protein [Sporosarcina sp. JAI121]|uniref:transporter substrate-binding domain-containing protein n=1 Tax=Sporosarcina sp. JAI121 TaxID=2723064 RepID=UPI0015C6E430|nr:transporter substrate-binding domain-containing protein [Sporosarcina sp. JAI121]NYF25716.1 polar amino acid transport system substrate-binding protein [Sporosarcina sp. JAI121]